MSDLITPNMGLTVPTVSQTVGPTYANEINGDLSILDTHNHTTGLGVPVPTSGLNINTDLTFNGVNQTSVRSTRFLPQSSPISNAADIGCIYVSGIDLYYNDGSANQIRITQNAAVAGTPGSISGLVSPASVAFSGVTFTFQSGTNIAGNLDARNIVLRNSNAGSNGLTLQPPAAMASNFSITLPTQPGSTQFLTLDSSGNILANTAIAGGITGAMIASGTITGTNIATTTIAGANIAQQTITQGLLATRAVSSNSAVGGMALGSSSGVFNTTSLSSISYKTAVTLFTTGRPVFITLVSAIPNATVTSGQNGAFIGYNGATAPGTFFLLRDGAPIAVQNLGAVGGGNSIYPPGVITHIDTGATGSTSHTYSFVTQNTGGGDTMYMNNVRLMVYEI